MKAILLFLLLTTFAPAQTWIKITVEGGAQASSPVVTLPAGTQYRFGAGAKFCDAVTVTTQTALTIWYATVPCKVNGVVTIDPAPGVQKEVDVAETAVPQNIPYTLAGKTTVVTVPALPPPPVTTKTLTNCKADLIGTLNPTTGAVTATLSLEAGCTAQ